MSCDTFLKNKSVIHAIDCRVRVACAFALSLLISFGQGIEPAGCALAGAVVLAAVARLPLLPLFKRLGAFNIFMAFAWAALCFSGRGGGLELFGLELSRAGALTALLITLKGNAILLIFISLLSTMEPTAFGAALQDLGIPRKLALLIQFSLRYTHLLTHEYERLHTAMRARCFKARADLHTCRTFGNMVGMLLLKSHDRSERILAAMKCRGWRGRFYTLDGEHKLNAKDFVFMLISLLSGSALFWAEVVA